MCGIAGIIQLHAIKIPNLSVQLKAMERLIAHRGPDDVGIWHNIEENAGFVHRRLSIIDLSAAGHQPMTAPNGMTIIFNGEIYNYTALRHDLSDFWHFQSNSDTETILAAYARYGEECVHHLRGMFAFAIWDGHQLFCARDPFGIKPFYYVVVGDCLIFASEVKALLPFMANIDTDTHAFTEYLVFQYPIGEQTLFKNIKQLMPAHTLSVKQGTVQIRRYWDICYDIDMDHSPQYFSEKLRALLEDSIDLHLNSDVDVGAYASGGIDSSLIALLGRQNRRHRQENFPLFNGRFLQGAEYDESPYAKIAAEASHASLYCADIDYRDFSENIQKIIYHLDYPVAGPGSFPQYMVSKMARQHVKVVLGGQGGDEIFGGYARYVIAYLEQCLKAAIDGTYRNGHFVVTAESIIPNLEVLQNYKPLLKNFWSDGLFGTLDARYFKLIDRSSDFLDEVNWELLDKESVYNQFLSIFNNRRNTKAESYFDSMTHFDFKCLLPGLLHVEDRVSMAHGLEARVPFLDVPLVEFMASVPANVKFTDGKMKQMLKSTFNDIIPQPILNRKDKMGFPVPLNDWFGRELKDFVFDVLNTGKNKHRPFIHYDKALSQLGKTSQFSRKLWAFFCIELWFQTFHDKAPEFRRMIPSDHSHTVTV